MIFLPTTLQGAWLIELEKRGDERGFFARTMCEEEFATHNLATRYVQQNLSVSMHRGTLRGMHFQRGSAAEAKLVRCTRGRILDVIVDLRAASATYMRHEGFELDDRQHRQLYVPPGFAHGFQTLSDDVEVSYLVSAPYTPVAEWGLRHDDPSLRITWPLPVTTISAKDAAWPLLTAEMPAFF